MSCVPPTYVLVMNMSPALTSLVTQLCLLHKDLPCVMQIFPHGNSENTTDFTKTWLDFRNEDLPMQFFNHPSLEKPFYNSWQSGALSVFASPIAVFLYHPQYFFQAEVFPALQMSYSQVLVVTSQNVSLAINSFGADKFLLKASNKAIIAIGDEKPHFDKHRYITAPIFHFDTLTSMLHIYCDCKWLSISFWNGHEFIPPIAMTPKCPQRTEIQLFMAYWAFMGYEEIYTLLLVSYITSLKIRVIFPRDRLNDCTGIDSGNENYLPNTFHKSYIWPLHYVNLEQLPLTFEFMEANFAFPVQAKTVDYTIDPLDIIGGAIILRDFLEDNSRIVNMGLPYEVTLSFDNRTPFPVARQPIELFPGVKYFNAFDKLTWGLLSLALTLITGAIMLTLPVENGLKTMIVIQFSFGFVRPSEYEAYVKRPSKGQSMLTFFWLLWLRLPTFYTIMILGLY